MYRDMFEQPGHYSLWQGSVQQHGQRVVPDQSTTVSSSTKIERSEKPPDSCACTADDGLKEAIYENGQAVVDRQQHYLMYNTGGYENNGYTDLTPIGGHTQTGNSSMPSLPSPYGESINPVHHHMMPPQMIHKPEVNQVEPCRPHGKISCSLTNSDLWRQFRQQTTEMIITKQGRRMFPTLQFTLSGLRPALNYTVVMDMLLSANSQWKFQNGKWIPSGQMDTQLPAATATYIHPDSPNSGAHFQRQDVTFAKMKLTNNKALQSKEQVVLSSMHKYQPRLTVTPQDGLQEAQHFTFSETEFVAVTAYQNSTITQLKIDNNPFAKGFRDNSVYNRQMISQGFARETTKSYHQQEPSYTPPNPIKPSYYDNTYRSMASCQHSSTSNTYPYPQLAHTDYYYPQRLHTDNSQYSHPVQMCQDQVAPYYSTHPNWYPNMDISPKQMQSSAQQPKRISNWLQHVEDNAHLQKTFEQIEKENNNRNKGVSQPADEHARGLSSQSHKKEVYWDEFQSMTNEKRQLPELPVNTLLNVTPQPPVLKNCAPIRSSGTANDQLPDMNQNGETQKCELPELHKRQYEKL